MIDSLIEIIRLLGYVVVGMKIVQCIGLGFSIACIVWTSSATAVHTQTLTTTDPQIQNLLQTGDKLFADDHLADALEHYKQVYQLYQQQNNLAGQLSILNKIGQIYHALWDPQSAAETYSQALDLSHDTDNPEIVSLIADILYSWGLLSFELARQDQTISLLNQVIELSAGAEIEPDTLGLSFYTLGAIAEDRGNFSDAIEFYTQARAIFEHAYIASGNEIFVEDQINTAITIGNIWSRLGDFKTAIQFYKQALALNADIESALKTSQILDNLGVVEARQGNYAEALDFYQQALATKESLDDTSGMGQTLHNIGDIYISQGKLQQALSALTQAFELTPSQHIGSIINLKTTTAIAYTVMADYVLAWENYHQALRLSLVGGERRRQIVATINLAKLMQQQQQSSLAIAFYKQAINDIEQVRDNLRSLPLETQQRYTETVADSYRELAALLLEQERVFEAQQVLDLLKIQELEDYLHDVRVERPQVDEKLPYLPPERILLEQHRALLLESQLDTDAVISLAAFLAHPNVAAALATLDQSDPSILKPESLQQLQQKLQTLPHKSAVLYPLVLEDRLELLLVPPDGPPIHQTTQINKRQLTEQVSHLRYQLADPSSDVKTTAGSLYKSLIAPFRAELNRLKIQNIIYIPDSVLHYIPLAVLYDQTERQWLAEQYTSHNLTASDFGDLTQPPSRPFDVLAGAFADASQTFEKRINQRNTNFHGLTYAGHEVSFLQKKLPSTQILLDADFSRNNLETQFQGQNIIHLATHAAFVPGQPEDSFILLGDGDTITLKELRNLSLPNVDLVVLSACQTGISHIEDGLEILGMGFQVQRTDARAALASLWWVDDRSTSQLMELFYTELTAGATKAEALQKAQRQLIATGQDEPYYWAPFVLIGNGL